MKKLTYSVLLCLFSVLLFGQTWQPTGSNPEGGGITEIIARESNGHLFATTGSFNWPSGDDGGVRRSTDNGDTWENLYDAYVARTILEGPDGNLYASIWPYPQNEGLYRSTDNGNTWTLLKALGANDNIFSIAMVMGATDYIIYMGTRNGVYRSLNNGSTWAYANTGIPTGSWVRGLDVDPNGVVAAGTTKGAFVSFDDGGSWTKITGEFENDTVVSVQFDLLPESKDDDINLYLGTSSGYLLVSTFLTAYAVAEFVYFFGANMEITKFMVFRLTSALIPYYFLSIYSATGGAFYSAMGNLYLQLFINGLPTAIAISMFTAILVNSYTLRLFCGLYGNTNGGAKVYKTDTDAISGIFDGLPFADPFGFSLFQNNPNPVLQKTQIEFELHEKGNAKLSLTDITGAKIKTLVNSFLDKGRHAVTLNGDDIKAGIYFYTLEVGNSIQTKKLIVQ
ncbi:MAG: T9SS type A sorting domain-containing protein [Bacteroidales bacterium]|nr:T9SS type A sorting domain-containing protein [Bacteroidales bacterium]MCF8403346.1 T9SS type A sorting domain-containing protein [Bacteroidales bacterium]